MTYTSIILVFFILAFLLEIASFIYAILFKIKLTKFHLYLRKHNPKFWERFKPVFRLNSLWTNWGQVMNMRVFIYGEESYKDKIITKYKKNLRKYVKYFLLAQFISIILIILMVLVKTLLNP